MLAWVLIGVLGAGSLCVAYGALVERTWFRRGRHRLDILPADLPERIDLLHLSDLHFVRGDRRKAAFLASLPAPDLTVVTGDLLGEPEAVETVVEALRPLRGRHGSYFVLGSNDYFRPEPVNYLRYFRRSRVRHRRAARGRAADLISQLEADGWGHLRNVRAVAALDGARIELLGLDDPHIHRHDLRVAPREAPDLFGLAVVHSPDPMAELAALGYDLVVAGHTHGGQVRLPFIGALVSNSTIPARMAMGLYRLGRAHVHISPGLGTSKFAPFRFLCRPEATVLELRRAPAGARTGRA
ncbi:MAG: metallophosphoesterase family protein [Actinobacteria bacterium]|nr:metallophosphoesterase family protein [Actinomycetota bacterium]